MATFADFILNLINYSGIGMIFLFIFYFAVFYALLLFLFRYMKIREEQKGDQQKKLPGVDNIIAFLISISAAFFLTTLSGYYLFTQYFLGFVAATLILFLFFIVISNMLTNGKFFEFISNPQRQSTGSSAFRYIPIVIIVILMVFAFVSMYYAYQSYFLSITSGVGLQAQVYQTTFNPYIIFTVFFFVIVGIFIIIMGSGSSGTSGGQQSGGKK
ncbi:hypothetical protein YN1_4190 [Nanoarchaeota archaeon]